jgi:Zn-dependent peptidase ImmA (M78 family)
LAAASFALELSDWMEGKFNLPKVNVPDLRGHKSESAAIALRAKWLIGSEAPFPNVIHMMERNGIRVFSLPEDYVEVDAYSCWVDDTPFVFLNTRKSGERGRFDAAHELGHLVLHRHSPPHGPAIENEANDFASALLMPASAMQRNAPRIPTTEALLQHKGIWRVSIASLVYRLHKLGLITDRQYRSLMVDISKRGWRTTEPASIPREASQVLQKVLVALREDGIKRDDIARTLRLKVSDLDTIIFGLVPTNIRGANMEVAPATPISPETPRGLRLVK